VQCWCFTAKWHKVGKPKSKHKQTQANVSKQTKKYSIVDNCQSCCIQPVRDNTEDTGKNDITC
jgi:hypothetical protein